MQVGQGIHEPPITGNSDQDRNASEFPGLASMVLFKALASDSDYFLSVKCMQTDRER